MSSDTSSRSADQNIKPAESNSNVPQTRRKFIVEQLKFKQDHRARLPLLVSRFLGYRPSNSGPPFEPISIPPFTWLHKIPLKYEVWIFGWIGAFGSILSIEAIMATNTAFRNDYNAPIIITSFGASAILLFGVIESPLSQPRNFVLGQFISALVGTCITRLFALNGSYRGYLDNTAFHGTTFINGGLSLAFSLLAQDMIGAIHPPAGATGLNAAVEPVVVSLSWRYLPVVVASSLIMLGWALLVNNLGRRRYPIYWWQPESRMVVSNDQSVPNEEEEELKDLEEGKLRKAEDGGRTAEALFDERLQGEGGTQTDLDNARDDDGTQKPEVVLREPSWKNMTAGDRQRAEGRVLR